MQRKNTLQLMLLLIFCVKLNTILAESQIDADIQITTVKLFATAKADNADLAILEELLNETVLNKNSSLQNENDDNDIFDIFNGIMQQNPEVVNQTQPVTKVNLDATICPAAAATASAAAVDLSAEKNQLELRLRNIFQPTVQQTRLLTAAIDDAFANIEQLFAVRTETEQTQQAPAEANKTQQTEQPRADPNAKSCGYQRECVELWMCKNSTINEYGAYIIQLRSLHNEDECKYNQVCCHIADKIQKANTIVQPAKIERCGYRNKNGLQLAVESARHNEANFGEFPWMVAVLMDENLVTVYIGGGSLLAPNVVLTAAHKVFDKSVDKLVVRAGEWDRQTANEIHNHQDRNVQLKIIHGNYDGRKNNIALLQLNTAFTLSPHITPICLPNPNERYDHARCIVTGWGKDVKNNGLYPNILKAIVVPVVPRDTCVATLRQVVNPRFNIDQSTICAGGEKDFDACHGDGGAPLVCPIEGTPNRYAQAGIVAWGAGCGRENVPAGYTNVPHLVSWITRELDKLNIDRNFYTA